MDNQRMSPSSVLLPVNDTVFQQIKHDWLEHDHKEISIRDFVPLAAEWFQSTKLCDLQGWEHFPYQDFTLGCNHYIESITGRLGWDRVQVLPNEYAVYTLFGKHGTEPGNLEPGKDLIITLPHWQYADLRPEWSDVLKECEQKNIRVHIDFAWLITARDLSIDLSHPCIKSFGMSFSKYGMRWNRAGIRWCRQRTIDSVTLLNHYYQESNTGIASAAAFMINRVPRDYLWNTYEQQNLEICNKFDLRTTKLIHVAHDQDRRPLGIGHMLGDPAPHSIQ